eukprot:752195-Hanusia_phi.AAC.4
MGMHNVLYEPDKHSAPSGGMMSISRSLTPGRLDQKEKEKSQPNKKTVLKNTMQVLCSPSKLKW